MKSMTAFGRGQRLTRYGVCVIELRCVNSRFLDFHFRLPNNLPKLESYMREKISKNLNRGSIRVFVKFIGTANFPIELVLNKNLITEYIRIIKEIKDELGVYEINDLNIGSFFVNRDLILVKENNLDFDSFWHDFEPAVEEALKEVETMRLIEGKNLKKDILMRVLFLEDLFFEMKKYVPKIIENYGIKIKDRIQKYFHYSEPDPQRLALEIAVLSDKSDVTEEIVRVNSHLDQLKEILSGIGPMGRKLEFLLQELMRETNTIISKISNLKVSKLCINVKSELEKLKEQIQNIE